MAKEKEISTLYQPEFNLPALIATRRSRKCVRDKPTPVWRRPIRLEEEGAAAGVAVAGIRPLAEEPWHMGRVTVNDETL